MASADCTSSYAQRRCLPLRAAYSSFMAKTARPSSCSAGTPTAVFMNSNYTSSFVAGLLQLRYMYSMPVERIIHYFEDQGFNLKKPTANFLLLKAAEALANSARMNHLNFFDYITDILDKTAKWQPNTQLENYRNLLPDRWQQPTKE